jgi:hypothetical protein
MQYSQELVDNMIPLVDIHLQILVAQGKAEEANELVDMH